MQQAIAQGGRQRTKLLGLVVATALVALALLLVWLMPPARAASVAGPCGGVGMGLDLPCRLAWPPGPPAVIAQEPCRFGLLRPGGPGAGCAVMLRVESWTPAILEASVTPLARPEQTAGRAGKAVREPVTVEYEFVTPDGRRVTVTPERPGQVMIYPALPNRVTEIRVDGRAVPGRDLAGVYEGTLTVAVRPLGPETWGPWRGVANCCP